MTKERFEVQFNVDLNKVEFKPSWNGLYQTSVKDVRGFYILEENNDYRVIDGRSNSVYHWRVDMHEMEEEN